MVSIFAYSWLAQPKKIVKSESDLPRFTYEVNGNVADLLRPDFAAFQDFATKVRADLQSIFDNYQVEDKSTERELLETRLAF